MKKHLLFISIILFIKVSLFGQQFVLEENRWNVIPISFTRNINTEIFRIDGDSMVSSVEYNKIWVSNDSLQTWSFQGLLRENSDTVWFMNNDSVEHVLYNFNLTVGDTTFITNIFVSDKLNEVYVEQLDTVEYFGVSRKRWLLISVEYGTSDYWIEGIGSLSGPLYSMYSCNIICPSWELLCFHHDETLLYIKEGEDDCWMVGIDEYVINPIVIKPNPVKSGYPLEIKHTGGLIKGIEIYDQSGKMLEKIEGISANSYSIETAAYKPGIYIVRITLKGNKIVNQKIMVN